MAWRGAYDGKGDRNRRDDRDRGRGRNRRDEDYDRDRHDRRDDDRDRDRDRRDRRDDDRDGKGEWREDRHGGKGRDCRDQQDRKRERERSPPKAPPPPQHEHVRCDPWQTGNGEKPFDDDSDHCDVMAALLKAYIERGMWHQYGCPFTSVGMMQLKGVSSRCYTHCQEASAYGLIQTGSCKNDVCHGHVECTKVTHLLQHAEKLQATEPSAGPGGGGGPGGGWGDSDGEEEEDDDDPKGEAHHALVKALRASTHAPQQ